MVFQLRVVTGTPRRFSRNAFGLPGVFPTLILTLNASESVNCSTFTSLRLDSRGSCATDKAICCMKEGRTARVDTIGLDLHEGVESDELSQVIHGANEARFFEPTRSVKNLASTIEHFLRLSARACCENHRPIGQER
jgi:hypothetical protein